MSYLEVGLPPHAVVLIQDLLLQQLFNDILPDT